MRQRELWGACCARGHASAAAARTVSLPAPAARAPTDTYPLLRMPWPGSTRSDLLPAELGREPQHGPVPVNTLLTAGCLPTLAHLPTAVSPPWFWISCLYRKSLDQARSRVRAAAPVGSKPCSIPQRAAWEGWHELLFFACLRQSWFPLPCSTALLLSDGPGARPGASRWWCKHCSLCAGGSQAAGVVLDVFSAGEQLCPELCAYSARLAPCPMPARRYCCQHRLHLWCWLQLSSTQPGG